METLPDWLSPAPHSKRTVGELLPFQYPVFFETVLDKLCSGLSLTAAMVDDVRDFDRAHFIRWINKDPDRKARYHEAQEIGAEVIAGEMIDIADGVNSLEDVQRSTLRINTRKFLLGVWNRKRYGETKQIEMSTTISISKALEQANSRVLQIDNVTDITSTPIHSIE